jgi:hypothetical protein
MEGKIVIRENNGPEHLTVGDVYSVYGLHGEDVFRVVKVVAVKPDSIHLFVYERKFPTPRRPSTQDATNVIKPPSHFDFAAARDMYMPVSRKLFSLMRPVFIGNFPPADYELGGYRQWCVTGGEILGDQFKIEDEIDQNWLIYSKIFLMSAVPFFVMFCTFYYFRYGFPDCAIAALLQALAYGGVMVVLQWSSIRQQKKDRKGRISASSIQFTEINLPSPYTETFENCVRALGTIKNCKPVIVDQRGGTIEARVRSTLMEEGQEVLLVASRSDNDGTCVIVWSESLLGMTVDMGRNLANVNTIVSFLQASSTDRAVRLSLAEDEDVSTDAASDAATDGAAETSNET